MPAQAPTHLDAAEIGQVDVEKDELGLELLGERQGGDTVGQPVTWVNNDDSPHQITVVSTKERSPIITKGQSAVLPFNTAGTYEYICGLHPNMKGTIEVK